MVKTPGLNKINIPTLLMSFQFTPVKELFTSRPPNALYWSVVTSLPFTCARVFHVLLTFQAQFLDTNRLGYFRGKAL